MNKLNLLLLLVALNVALVALGVQAGFGDLFKKKDKPNDSQAGEPKSSKEEGVAAAAPAAGAGRGKKLANLDEVRAAEREQDRLSSDTSAPAEANTPKYPKRLGYQAPSGRSKMVQGRARRGESEVPDQQDDEEEDDDYEDEMDDAEIDGDDDYEQAMAEYRKQQNGGRSVASGKTRPEGADSGPIARIKNKDLRDQLAAKYVSTRRTGEGRQGAGGSSSLSAAGPKINNVRRLKKVPSTQDDAKSTSWGQRFDKALKVTKQGIKKGAIAISELPKYVEQAADSVNALLKLDGKGKLLALIEQVKGDIHFVRKEFSQFTLSWSPQMEQALNYLGDKNLDKIKWSERDELDLRKDALHSIVLGYEFMRLMIAWRENLLIAHEAYKLWLESLKTQYEEKHFEVDEDLLMQLSTIQSYLLLSAWGAINERTQDTRMKLNYLMEIEDDRPKNYESEFFRNIIVLQEMYYPTIEELDKEVAQVNESISTSGVVVDNLEQVTEFYGNFRKSIESGQLTDVDCKVPDVLYEFMEKLQPQVENTPLVYTKGFIRDLKEAAEERRAAEAEAEQDEQPAEAPPKRKKGLSLW